MAVFVELGDFMEDMNKAVERALAGLGARSVDDNCIKDVLNAMANVAGNYASEAATSAGVPDEDSDDEDSDDE